MELAWLLTCGLALWVGVIGLLWILWPWRAIPAILRETSTHPEPSAEGAHHTLPEGAQWYREPEPPTDPTTKNVYWPD